MQRGPYAGLEGAVEWGGHLERVRRVGGGEEVGGKLDIVALRVDSVEFERSVP